MLSDDLTALAAISMGALASAAVTVGVMAGYDEESEPVRVRVEVEALPQPTPETAPRAVVDYAIIRDEGRALQLTVGPERPHTGPRSRSPRGSLEMRLQRSR